MLKRIQPQGDASGVWTTIGDAASADFFYDGLQYSPPARGPWNIVHTNMLVPGSHQIYICALGCLRGVVLTAAEMGAMDRFSSIVVEEQRLYDGTMEDFIVASTGDILSRLPQLPKACFLYPSCIHHFMGCDMDDVCHRLQKLYGQTKFVLCWMDPIRRHSKLTAEMRTRRQIYSLLEPTAADPMSVNLIGSNLPVQADCELRQLLQKHGRILRELPSCKTWADYQAMASSVVNIGQEPPAHIGLDALQDRLGQKGLYVSNSFSADEIEEHLWQVADMLDIPYLDCSAAAAACEEEFSLTKSVVGSQEIAIDAPAVFRPFNLAKVLLEHGFAVSRIYADAVGSDDSADFQWLKAHYPELRLYSIRHAAMRRADRHTDRPVLAIGQKAAYFTGTTHFVNMAENGGLRDFAGLRTLLRWMREAAVQEKEVKPAISRKGWGCTSCL